MKDNIQYYTQGKYHFYYREFETTDFGDPDQFIGRNIKDRDVQELMVSAIEIGCIFSDILVAQWNGEFFLMAGKKRVLVSHYLSQGLIEGYAYNPEKYKTLHAKVYVDVPPDDQAIWAILDNQIRSNNPIDEWLYMQQLVKEGKWDEYANRYKLNKSHWNSMSVLNNLINPDAIADFVHRKQITVDHVFKLAKLPRPKQEVIYGMLNNNKHVVEKDFKEVIAAKNLQAVERIAAKVQGSMQQVADVPVVEPTNFMFVGKDAEGVVFHIWNWITPTQVQEFKKEHPNGEGYRLTRVC